MKIVLQRIPRPNVATSLDLPEGARVLDALRGAGIPPDAVVVLREGRPIPTDHPLASGDELRVINVFSGG